MSQVPPVVENEADQKSTLIQCLSFSTLKIIEISTLIQYYLGLDFQPQPK